MKSTFGKNIIMLILKQEITFNLRFPILMSVKLSLCIGQIEASTCPPGQPPGHLTFLKIIVQIPPRSNAPH